MGYQTFEDQFNSHFIWDAT